MPLAVPGEGSAVETHTGSPSHVPLHTGNSWLSSAGHQTKSRCLCFGALSHEDSLSSKMTGYKNAHSGRGQWEQCCHKP